MNPLSGMRQNRRYTSTFWCQATSGTMRGPVLSTSIFEVGVCRSVVEASTCRSRISIGPTVVSSLQFPRICQNPHGSSHVKTFQTQVHLLHLTSCITGRRALDTASLWFQLSTSVSMASMLSWGKGSLKDTDIPNQQHQRLLMHRRTWIP